MIQVAQAETEAVIGWLAVLRAVIGWLSVSRAVIGWQSQLQHYRLLGHLAKCL